MPQPTADPAPRARQRSQHRRIGWTDVLRPDERLADGSPLHLMVVLADDRLFRGDIGIGQGSLQQLAQVDSGREPWRWFDLPRRPDALQLAQRHAIVQERAIEIGDHGAVVADPQPAVARKAADRRGLDTFPGKDLLQRRPALGRHRQHHPLLRFGEPDLPRPQSVVLEGHTRQLDVGPQLARHLADRRREPARSAIGDGAVEPEIARARQGVGQALLDDGIADLDDAAKLRVTGSRARRTRTSRRGCRRARRAPRRRRSGRRLAVGWAADRAARDRPCHRRRADCATYPWSNSVAPLTVGMPILLP